jgi:hypothetical protein
MIARLVAVTALLIVCPYLHAQAQACPFRYPEARCGNGELRYINGLPVLTVVGTPEEIGEAVGALAVAPGRKMLDYPEDVLRDYHLHALWKPLLWTCRAMAERFPDDYAREMDGIIRGGRVERDPIIAGNTLFDVKKLFACSALLVGPERSTTGSTLVGRNLDYPSLGYAHEYSLVTVYRPSGARHAFATVGFPGLVGCLSGMNDAGLTVAILESFQARVGIKRFDRCGTPYALCYRRLLEECSTVDQAIALLATMHRASMTNLILADKKTVAVAEVTPERIVVRGPENGCCICTNHFCTEKLKPIVPVNITHSWQRYDILQHVADCNRRIGLSEIQKGLHAARDDEETLQAMIFDPAALRLYLAIGHCPATSGEMRGLDLEPLFHPVR